MERVLAPRWSLADAVPEPVRQAREGVGTGSAHRGAYTQSGGGGWSTQSSSHVGTAGFANAPAARARTPSGGSILPSRGGPATRTGFSPVPPLPSQPQASMQSQRFPMPIPVPATPPRHGGEKSQLSAATLGSFHVQPHTTFAEPKTTTPERPVLKSTPETFERNFPSLGNSASPTPHAPAPLAPVAWGKPDVVSIVAAPATRKKSMADVGIDGLDHADDVGAAVNHGGEAAEIARLMALVPKPIAKSNGKTLPMGARERPKPTPVSKGPLMKQAQLPQKPAAAKPIQIGAKAPIAKVAATAPVPIPVASARPKLRSSMKPSPRNNGGAAFPSMGVDGHLDCEALAPPGLSKRPTPSSETYQVRADSDDTDIASTSESWDADDARITESPPYSSPPSSPRPPTPSHPASPTLTDRSSPRSTTPTTSTPRTPLSPAAAAASISVPAEASVAAPDPYMHTVFAYSASLEKEEQFLRTLGWDKRDYYAETVDETQFIITEEEKREFWAGVRGTAGVAGASAKGRGRGGGVGAKKGRAASGAAGARKKSGKI
ncbi:hypothetical protein BDK51DRAFT_31827 [Blyttiomyces helicus]|uniref:Uncharacterized protein n=1 Tax=Blyttiomyces helicus TaxID=388810 RepID=A0A4V1IRG2_9FUNG|nr:hypothetical protein BDK51DRAFT_31827 [Blyttiomyces helicus]|eukprot:RKO89947.1 hypothetical protein BDK51DRAFT_31827 [Blyttiomyces helicus]